MGFMDKMKAQATQVGQKAQEAGKAGQAKMEGAQAKKRADALMRDLGAAVYAEKTGKSTGETAAEVERLVSELRSLEDTGGPVSTAPTADTVTGGAATAAPEGDFKLDDL